MRVNILVAVFASLLVVACGSKQAGSTGAGLAASLATLPATVEGELIAGVDEGDADEEDTSDHAFGTLSVGGESVDVVIDVALLKAAALPDDTGKVRATLGSRTDQYGPSAYVVTSLQKL